MLNPDLQGGRPLIPLKSGHIGLLAVGGMLNGIFGSGDERHISFWQAVKLTDRVEEEDEQGVDHGQREGTLLQRTDGCVQHGQSRCIEVTLPPTQIPTTAKSHNSQEEIMKNAHERFGVLEYTKRMKDTTTRIHLRLDRFIGEVEDGRNGKAHLISVLGGDSDVGAIWAAVIEQNHFTVEAPGIEPVHRWPR